MISIKKRQRFYKTALLLWVATGLTISVDWSTAIASPTATQASGQHNLSSSTFSREDVFVESDPGIEIFVREVVPNSPPTGVPILLIHGGGPGGIASFDLDVPGYSLAADFAYARTAVRLDPTSQARTPPSARIPTAYREESFNLAQGYRTWEARNIYTPTLFFRGELDFWSRPEDGEALASELVNAPAVQTVTIPDATHYLFLDRPERGRNQFIQETLSFLRQH